MIRTVLTALITVCAAGAQAQSIITLDDLDLGAPAPAPQASAADEMKDCILNPSACDNAEYGGGAAFSLEDVVNLGVIDHAEAKAQPQVAKAAPLPSIDIEILFAYDSDDLTPQAQGKLAELVQVLRDPRFDDQMLLFVGHTDGVGSASYNTALSQRRAQAVARYVQDVMDLPPSRIDARGVGFSRLKNVRNPDAAENRRVQLVLVQR
ncbi:OmpA family protein [Tropicibacter naphthalenivorans]|uniref:Outer membrane protein class 4 n=1 Tax=Tropicibacter naphthalenivorans TaxID=441103 RepID=A0A0P1FZV7_9RHOB|nr:OmpA family protein [Tropicibacter naphthalenivorans]CUH74966.1 Outer membrane protein class 4 precursor [Tropicibacter naphthalenivorans]SMC47762.1 Outer membrane protein OmpA [Tropicibacter naphthalenivorans]